MIHVHLLLTELQYSVPEIPQQAQKFFPENTQSFGDGLWEIIKRAVAYLNPNLTQAAGLCVCLFGIMLLVLLLDSISASTRHIHKLLGTIAISLTLLQSTGTLINLGIDTVRQLSDYGKLLLPVMTGALAAEGGVATSSALYVGTIIFDTVLTSILSNLIIPLVYVYLIVGIVQNAVENDFLQEINKFVKWIMTWILKITLYVFTGYIGVTGVVSGTADASAIKATKLAISGAVPVVGNIISDASETILVSAGMVKNSVGVAGLFAVLALWIGPFLQIGAQYILLKLTAGLGTALGDKNMGNLVKNFAGTLGFLLAATGAMSLMLLISTVCFMRGIG